jgi:uncharacterized membrane protein YidH (DUF202 family)
MTEAPKSFYFLPKTAGPTPAIGETENENTLLSPTQDAGSSTSWFMGLFGRKGYQSIQSKLRKVPTKVEPKVFFANERTFLAWMHMAVTLSSIAVAILAFAESNEWSEVYGLMLMPVAISFVVYALYMYMRRATMIRARHPGPCTSCLLRAVAVVLLYASLHSDPSLSFSFFALTPFNHR